MKPYVKYSEEIANEICREISTSHLGLRRLCDENPHWPTRKNIHCWLVDHAYFRDQYTLAKKKQAEWLVEDALEVAYDGSQDTVIDSKGKRRCDNEWVQRSRLIVDTIKWSVSVLEPKVYGSQAGKEDGLKDANLKEEIVKTLRDISSKCMTSI